MQTGLVTSLWAAVDLVIYLTIVSATEAGQTKLLLYQQCQLTDFGTVSRFPQRSKKNSDGTTVICYLMCHLPNYTRIH